MAQRMINRLIGTLDEEPLEHRLGVHRLAA